MLPKSKTSASQTRNCRPKDVREYEKFTGERYEVGIFWTEPEKNLPNNYISALGLLYSQEQRLQREPNLKSLYRQSIDTYLEKGFVKISNQSKMRCTFGNEWYSPHHPVLNPKKTGKVRRVCNAASKYKEVFLKKAIRRSWSATWVSWNNFQI